MASSNAFYELNCTSFLGFTYNGLHSSRFGLYRVTSSDRYTVDLIPTSEAKTIHVPGLEGSYFFGAEYKQKTFSIEVSFDNMTEIDLSMLKAWLTGGVNDLVFDEMPYKAYYAKPDGGLNLNIVCYEELHPNSYNELVPMNIYKGEGTINFTCYYPFAHSTYKFLEDFPILSPKTTYGLFPVKFEGNWEIDEWKKGTNLLLNRKGEDKYLLNNNSISTLSFTYDKQIKIYQDDESLSTAELCRYYWYNAGNFSAYPLIEIEISINGGKVIYLYDVINKKNPNTLLNKKSDAIIPCVFGFNALDTTIFPNGTYKIFLDTKTKNVTYYNISNLNKIYDGNRYCMWLGDKWDNFNFPPCEKNERNYLKLGVSGSKIPDSYKIKCYYRYYYI